MLLIGWIALGATGSHGSTTQSTCIRSKQPDGSVVTQSLAPSDPNGLQCGQWICNAPTLNGQFTTPLPCVTPPLTINATAGDTVAIKPITVPGGEWTLTIYLKEVETAQVYGPYTWQDGTDATAQRTQSGSAHWKVHNMATSGADAGAFEVWFGDPLVT